MTYDYLLMYDFSFVAASSRLDRTALKPDVNFSGDLLGVFNDYIDFSRLMNRTCGSHPESSTSRLAQRWNGKVLSPGDAFRLVSSSVDTARTLAPSFGCQ